MTRRVQTNEQLKQFARSAILSAGGDTEKALAGLDDLITVKNSAALERELCSAYRTSAMRALLATHYNELRAEGRIAPLPQDDDEITEAARSSSWAQEHVKKIEERKANYLNDFRVNGEPIGDCTPEIVLEQADRRERDARFMRMMASGVPPGHKIREFVTEEEATDYWERSQETPEAKNLYAFDLSCNPRWSQLWKWLLKGIQTENELDQAIARAGELMDAKEGTADGVELDGLARVIKEYEDAHG